jgi:hypothetical protein
MTKFYSYSPKDVVVMYGATRITGFGDGDFVTISKREDTFTTIDGADGDTTRSLNPSTTYDVTITLLDGSASNDALSGYYIADAATGLGTQPLSIKQVNGRDLFIAETCWLNKPADVTKSKEAGTREWPITAYNGQLFVGGL